MSDTEQSTTENTQTAITKEDTKRELCKALGFIFIVISLAIIAMIFMKFNYALSLMFLLSFASTLFATAGIISLRYALTGKSVNCDGRAICFGIGISLIYVAMSCFWRTLIGCTIFSLGAILLGMAIWPSDKKRG